MAIIRYPHAVNREVKDLISEEVRKGGGSKLVAGSLCEHLYPGTGVVFTLSMIS